MCLRIATTQALTGQTIAESRVRDSSIVDLENAIAQTPNTIILVYTDDSEFAPDGREVWGGHGTVSLVLIVAVAGINKLQDGTSEFTFPATDRATELSLDIAERQIQAALMAPDSVWAQRWRGIVSSVNKWTSKRGASTKEGVRFAARQITIECETMHDPIPGAAVEGEWATFLEVLEAQTDTDLSGLAEPLRALMERPDTIDWKRSMMEQGLDRQAIAGIGLAPFLFHPLNEAPAPATLQTIVADDDHLVTEITPEEGQ